MEAVPAIQDDSSGANPSSVKSEGSSPRHDGGRGSPPPNCAICLGTCRNKSFTDSCLHQFCFKCLLTWSKVKAECPLCKQNFKSIIHNVRSNHQYEEYMVEQQQVEEVTERADVENLRTVTRRFRYSTTFTLPRHESIAIQQLLMHHYPLMAGVLPPPRRRRSPASFRRTVYRHNLWARPLPDFTGRFRDSTPEFYRYNDTQMHRLVPWLNRELSYLLNDNVGHISYVMTRILELLPQYNITSPEFRDAMRRYFGDRTEHFLHELFCFASTPYDMTGYDRNVQYTTDSRISTMVNEVISSSESDASVDSDIVMVSSSEPAEVPAGPSGVPPPDTNNVIPIETISQSDTDDDSSEVMVVGYIKPPQDRTPEVVDLLGSDSDVVVQEGSRPEPQPDAAAAAPDPGEARPAPVVKLILKRQRADQSDTDDSDSDDSEYRPPAARRRRRPRSRDSATTADTRAPTPDTPHTPDTPNVPNTPLATTAPLRRTLNASTSTATTSASASSSLSESDLNVSSDNDSDSDGRRPRFVRRKSTKRSCKDAPAPRRERRRGERQSSRNRRTERKPAQEVRVDRERRGKRKSHSGKGVKSSKRRDEAGSERAVEYAEAGVQAAGPSGTSARRRRRRPSRDARRLRSVVNVIYGGAGSSAASVVSVASAASGASGTSSFCSVAAHKAHSGSESAASASASGASASASAASASASAASAASDSDDDLPLNLTVHRAHTVS